MPPSHGGSGSSNGKAVGLPGSGGVVNKAPQLPATVGVINNSQAPTGVNGGGGGVGTVGAVGPSGPLGPSGPSGPLGPSGELEEESLSCQTPSSSVASFEIKRCDLTWSGNSNSCPEAFTPVENCEIEPVVILACGSHRFDDDDLEGGRRSNLIVHYRWRRGPARAVCFFHPHRIATLQCTVTLRCYCGYDCFCRGHIQLRRFYTSGGKCAVPRQANEFSYGVPCQKFPPLRQERSRDPDETHHRLLRQAGLVVDPEKEIWPVISYSRNYCPRADDVGHQLKFEVVVCTAKTQGTSNNNNNNGTIHNDQQQQQHLQSVNSAVNSTVNSTVNYDWNHNGGGGHEQQQQQQQSITPLQQPDGSNSVRFHRGRGGGGGGSVAAGDPNSIISGPRSSPVNRSRYSHGTTAAGVLDIELRNNEEQKFWEQYDGTIITSQRGEEEEERCRTVVTACVVPQVPLIGHRVVVPVGILAILNGGDCEFSQPQRVIIPGSPLAEALGIGILPDRLFHMLPKRPRLNGRQPHEPSGNNVGGYWQHQNNYNPPRHLEKQRNAIREKRLALLTENAFAAWTRNEPTKRTSDSSHRINSTDIVTINGVKTSSSNNSTSSITPGNGRNCDYARNITTTTNVATTGSANKHLTSAAAAAATGGTSGGPSPSKAPPGNGGLGAMGQQTIDMGGESFSVMTWNVLADIFSTMEAYPYSEPFVLAWNYRKGRILAEIVAYNPDIICLQEVQADHFEDFFAPALLRRGYEGLYKQKTSSVFRGSGKHRGGRYVCDGCATFFRVPKFHLADHFGIEFARVAPPAAKQDKRLNKDNVALVLCLEQLLPTTVMSNRNGKTPTGLSKILIKDGGSAPELVTTRQLIVANTHILANPEAPDVKIWQAHTLTSVLTEYMEKTYAYSPIREMAIKHTGLIVCGDFNSAPDSAVYQLVTSGKCDARHEEFRTSEVYRWLHEIPLGHGLNLKSSYGVASYSRIEANRAMANGNNNPTSPYITNYQLYEPEFTNYTHQYVGCLDYIFFDDRTLKITGTLDLVREIQLMEEAHSLQLSDWALPSPQRPSDHTPLMARFEWIR